MLGGNGGSMYDDDIYTREKARGLAQSSGQTELDYVHGDALWRVQYGCIGGVESDPYFSVHVVAASAEEACRIANKYNLDTYDSSDGDLTVLGVELVDHTVLICRFRLTPVAGDGAGGQTGDVEGETRPAPELC
jgi:hypothetical protein